MSNSVVFSGVAVPPSPHQWYHNDYVAIRFTNPSPPALYVPLAAHQFIELIDDLVDVATAADARFTDRYGTSQYRSDRPDCRLILENSDPRNWFLDYEHIIHVMYELMGAATALSDGYLYDGPFEVWTPGDRPGRKVLDGYWQGPAEGRVAEVSVT